eukprot:9206-Heterococcus_DN1.PRE.5
MSSSSKSNLSTWSMISDGCESSGYMAHSYSAMHSSGSDHKAHSIAVAKAVAYPVDADSAALNILCKAFIEWLSNHSQLVLLVWCLTEALQTASLHYCLSKGTARISHLRCNNVDVVYQLSKAMMHKKHRVSQRAVVTSTNTVAICGLVVYELATAAPIDIATSCSSA